MAQRRQLAVAVGERREAPLGTARDVLEKDALDRRRGTEAEHLLGRRLDQFVAHRPEL